MKCHFEGCLIASDFICSCQNSGIGICKVHLLNHITSFINISHMIKASNNAETDAIIFELKNKIIELNHEKIKIISNVQNEINKLICQSNQTVEKINQEIEKIEETIKGLSISGSDARNKVALEEIQKDLSQGHIQEVIASSQENISIPQNVHYSNQISFFKSRLKLLITYNLEDFSVSENYIGNLEAPHNKTSMCLLPNGNIFCYGERNIGRYFGTTFIIDDSYNAKYLIQGIECTFSGLINKESNNSTIKKIHRNNLNKFKN